VTAERTPARRRNWGAHLRYLRALAVRFRLTLLLAAVLFVATPALFVLQWVGPNGERVQYLQALHHVYFLLFGQPSLPYVDHAGWEALNLLIPPVGLATVVDGAVRFAYLFFARHAGDKEWIEVMTETLRGHVVVCGAGRVGYRVVEQLLALGQEVAVVDKREDAAFVATLRDLHVPVLVDDLRSSATLERLNVRGASAIVCATDDDLANLNSALDARRQNPRIRVVMRLFDDDLVAKVRDAFQAEALSSSAVAAPAMALAALDPRVEHSFQVGVHRMVVSRFTSGAPLAGKTLSELRDDFGALALSLARGTEDTLHPRGNTVVQVGDVLVLQASWEDYRRLRAHAGEAEPPVSRPH
jgi:voltage-gated potassium channel